MAAEINRRQLLTGGAAGLGLAGAAAGGAFGAGWRPFEGAAAETGREPVRASGGNGMNVMVVILDEVRADHIGAYGSSVQTPNIDALADSGVRFTRPFSESMPTVPVRRAVHTGLRSFPFRHWEPWPGLPQAPGWQPIRSDESTFSEILTQVGYTRVAIADTPYYFRPSMNLNRGYGSYRWKRGQGFDPHGLPGLVSHETAARYLAPEQRDPEWGWYDSARKYLAEALEWEKEDDWPGAQLCTEAATTLGKLRELQPFVLFFDTFETHSPYFPPHSYRAMYGDYDGDFEPILPTYGSSDYLTKAQIERTDELYSGEITFTDKWVGRVFNALHDNGLAENTLVFFLTDHGTLLGGSDDHHQIGKPDDMLFPGLTDTAMIARHPERSGGVTSDVFAGTHDIVPTALANLDVSIDQPLDGADMLDPKSAVAKRDYATLIYSHNLWARDERYTLIALDYGEHKQLYDRLQDPHFKQDLAKEKPEVVQRLWGRILADAGGDIPQYT